MDRKVDDVLNVAAYRMAAAPINQAQVSVSIGKVVIKVGKRGRRAQRERGSRDIRGLADASEGTVNYVSDPAKTAESMCPAGLVASLLQASLKCLFLLSFCPPIPM